MSSPRRRRTRWLRWSRPRPWPTGSCWPASSPAPGRVGHRRGAGGRSAPRAPVRRARRPRRRRRTSPRACGPGPRPRHPTPARRRRRCRRRQRAAMARPRRPRRSRCRPRGWCAGRPRPGSRRHPSEAAPSGRLNTTTAAARATSATFGTWVTPRVPVRRRPHRGQRRRARPRGWLPAGAPHVAEADEPDCAHAQRLPRAPPGFVIARRADRPGRNTGSTPAIWKMQLVDLRVGHPGTGVWSPRGGGTPPFARGLRSSPARAGSGPGSTALLPRVQTPHAVEVT